MSITTRIETAEEIVERRAQVFFDRYRRRPYGLTLELLTDALRRQQTPVNRFAKED